MTTVPIDERVSLRAETPDDYEYLAAVYASTREEELRPVPWTEEQKLAFLRSQFDAQTAHYRNHYRAAEFWVIERDGERAGRLYLHYTPDDLRIVDIALAPAARGHGIGSTLLRRLLEDAADKGRSVSIHVERMNPAMRLYQRLGFHKIDEHGIYDLMSWSAGGETKG